MHLTSLYNARHFEMLNRLGVCINYCQCSNGVKYIQGCRPV